jgi:hypothetical protein
VRFTRAPAGNLETLNEIPKKLGIDIRAELLKFHAEKYSSNIMKLAVFGRGECSLFLLNESKASSQSCTSCRLVFFFFFYRFTETVRRGSGYTAEMGGGEVLCG